MDYYTNIIDLKIDHELVIPKNEGTFLIREHTYRDNILNAYYIFYDDNNKEASRYIGTLPASRVDKVFKKKCINTPKD